MPITKFRGGSYVIDPATGEAVLTSPPAKQLSRAERRQRAQEAEAGPGVDAVSALVAPGEYVIEKSAVKVIGFDPAAQVTSPDAPAEEPEVPTPETEPAVEPDPAPEAEPPAQGKSTKRARASKE